MTESRQRLIIRVSHGSLSFSTTEGTEVVFEPYAFNSSISMAANLREALRSVPLLGYNYRHVDVMVDSPVLMVPVDLFRDEEKEALYYHAFLRQEMQTVLHSVLPSLNAVAVFSLSKDLCTVVHDAFADVHFMAAVTPVWRHLHQRSYTGTHQKLYGYFHDKRMEVFSFGKNRFNFCNSYPVNNPNDALYYLLAAWKLLALEPEHDELHLVGEIDDRDAFLDEARKYVKRVFYINPSGEFNRAQVTQIPGMPYDLMTLYIKGK